METPEEINYKRTHKEQGCRCFECARMFTFYRTCYIPVGNSQVRPVCRTCKGGIVGDIIEVLAQMLQVTEETLIH